MDLLPTHHEEFSRPDYWNRFFKKRGAIPFEWYGEYPQLHPIIHKYITPSNKVLVVGCGNSALSENMYDNGLQNLINIDISNTVIRQMNDQHKHKRPKMTFQTMDVTQMSFSDGEFHAVIDKGTLDALLVNEETEIVGNVRRMFDEICRCLRQGGRYIIISLLQDHILKLVIEYFTNIGWPIRVHKVDMEVDGAAKQSSSSLPTFAVILTKLKLLPNMPQIVEVCRFGTQIDRLEDVRYLSCIVKDVQYYHTIRQQIHKKLPSDQQISLSLYVQGSDTPRYTLTIVDSPTPLENKFAIFIVPQGRENEWMFSTDKGRLHLQDSALYQRLIVTTLNRGHDYENLEEIKAELSSKVMELTPDNFTQGAKAPFLSIGEDIGKRFPVAKGRSDMTGEYLVEDVEMNGAQIFRRLVFMSNQNVTQTEARMSEGRKKKKQRNKAVERMPEKLKVDKSYLSSEYLHGFIGGFAFLPSLDLTWQGVVIGLGGGSFSNFVQGVFPKITMDAVELDPVMVDIATNFFNLETDEKLRVHVADGIKYMQDLYSAGSKQDIIFIDADCKDSAIGMFSPAPPFLTADFLTTASNVLSDDGIFIVNLACRDESLKQEMLQLIQSFFQSCAILDMKEDINALVYASKRPPEDPFLNNERLRETFASMDSQIKAVWADTNVELEEFMEDLKFLD